MVLVAIAMTANLDTRFQTAIASDLPGFLVNPTKGLEESRRRLHRRIGRCPAAAAAVPAASSTGRSACGPTGGARLHRHPGLVQHAGRQAALDERPARQGGADRLLDLHLHQLHPHASLPRGLARSATAGRPGRGRRPLARVPLREGRQQRAAAAIRQNHLTYPVVQDNDLGTWDAWGNQYWPAEYLVDAQGQHPRRPLRRGRLRADRARDPHAAGRGRAPASGSGPRRRRRRPRPGRRTPETYLGAARAQGWVNPVQPGDQDFGPPPPARSTQPVRLRGPLGDRRRGRDPGPERRSTWSSTRAASSSSSARRGRPRHVQVLLDGKPIPAKLAGADVRGGAATIRAQRLYRLVDLPAVSQHRLTLRFDPGISGYAFTFG